MNKPIKFPNLPPSVITWQPVYNVANTQGEFDFSNRYQIWNGQRWEADIEMRPYNLEDARILRAFIVSLKAGSQSFTMGPIADRIASGNPAGLMVVDGNTQAANSLKIKGARPNVSNIFGGGDWFSINDYLFMVSQNADSDSQGNAVIHIFPSVQDNIKDGDEIEYEKPMGTFRTQGNLPLPSVRPAGISDPYNFHIMHEVYINGQS